MTGDSNYVTPEGVRVGDNGVTPTKTGILVGDSPDRCEYELPSGWRIVIEKIGTPTIGNYITFDAEKSKVSTIRKYKKLGAPYK